MRALRFVDPEDVRAAIDAAASVVARGGVVVVPSESFYGLACDPSQDNAVARIHALKARPSGLGLPVACADWQQVEDLVEIPAPFRIKLSRLWPAALTVVVAARRSLPASRAGTLAVRIPAHAALRSLAYRAGPLTVTSANRHGAPPCTTIEEVASSLVEAPDMALDAGETAGGAASTLVDLTGPEPRILRFGAVAWDDPVPEN
jgi:tRNA threonylcarbamoyl adenosine modification protein (Sua5/YciO/YrdC/YwlC family)